MAKDFMYILLCCDDSYYTGSTKEIEFRFKQRQAGEGSNYTKCRLPVKLAYFEEYDRIDFAFNREKQVQKWSRKKKEALISGESYLLPQMAKKVFRNKVGPSIPSIRPPASDTQGS